MSGGRILLFTLMFCFSAAMAQQHGNARMDSLLSAVSTAKDDTDKVSLLTTIGAAYSENDPKKGLIYNGLAIDLAKKLGWKSGLSTAYNNLGAMYRSLSDYPNALENYFKSLALNEELNNRLNVARSTSNIGNLYRELKDYPKAMEYLNRSLKENEKLNRKFGISGCFSDLAIIYSEMNDNTKALDYFKKALAISEEIDDKEGVAIVDGNIGNVYSELKKYDLAIEFFTASNKVNDELGRDLGKAVNYTNLAQVYYVVAVDSDKKKDYSFSVFGNKQENLDKAIFYYDTAVAIFSRVGLLDDLSSDYHGLSDVFVAKNDYKNALEAYKHYKVLVDSVFSKDNKLKLAGLTTERAEFEKKQQEKLTELSQNKRRNESILFIVVVALFSVFTVFVISERRKSEKLLLNILPAKVARELKEKGSAAARGYNNVTILFTDFAGFTSFAEKMEPRALVEELHTCFKAFDEITSKYGIEKIKTVGDAYLAIAGLPEPDSQHAVNVVSAAIEMAAFIARRRQEYGERAFDMRIGINSGSVVAGIVGVKKFAYDIWGDAVNTAARLEQNCEPGKINISESTYELVKDKFICEYRGEVFAKNKGMLKMYYVIPPAIS
jgi:adenylate cyclase